MKMKWIQPDKVSTVFVIIGLVLMGLTVAFRVNPIEGSVVNPVIRGTGLHLLLLFTTMTAWWSCVLLIEILPSIGNEGFAPVLLMFVCQLSLYFLLGKVVSFAVAAVSGIAARNRKSHQD